VPMRAPQSQTPRLDHPSEAFGGAERTLLSYRSITRAQQWAFIEAPSPFAADSARPCEAYHLPFSVHGHLVLNASDR